MSHKPRKVFIGSAWPYVNGRLHLGHAAALLPADVLARYHRLMGDQVLWTSGSDCHGTPITERARAEGCTPREVAERFHTFMIEDFARLGFTYSIYWATMEAHHHERVQDSFLELWNAGFIYEADYHMATCGTCAEHRADREINGVCPKCNTSGARGDQCDACGELLNPSELVQPVCTKCKGSISFETSKELFLDLPRLQERLNRWVHEQTHWRDNAKSQTEAWLTMGLKPRAITRNLDWGIKVPLPGWENRRIYVWFEAVHGYLTASMEWAQASGTPHAWQFFWLQGIEQVLAYYVIGKDNIPFHTLIWPGILMAKYPDYVLPWHIVSSEFLNVRDQKLSKSAGRMIYVHDLLDRYDPDLLRYFLIANGPEKQDTNFSWEQFIDCINNEVVNNYSNLVHRVLSFVAKHYNGTIPMLDVRRMDDDILLLQCHGTFQEVGAFIEQTEFRRAVEKIMELVQATNRYIHDQAPWGLIKVDPLRAQTVINTCLHVIASLAVLTQPVMPTQADRLMEMLGLRTDQRQWAPPVLDGGRRFGTIAPLFKRLDKRACLAEETQKASP